MALKSGRYIFLQAWIHAQGDAADDGDSSPRDSMAPMGRESLAATSSQESIAAFSRSNSGNAASASSAVSARDRKKAAIANAAAAQREAKAERVSTIHGTKLEVRSALSLTVCDGAL